MWKRLDHKAIVPFLGITTTPLQLISEWMSGGNLTKHIGKHLNANRLSLAGVPPFVFDFILTPAPGMRHR